MKKRGPFESMLISITKAVPILFFMGCLSRSSCLPGSSYWENISEKEDVHLVSDIQVDSSQLPLVKGDDGQQVFRFYWLDAYEDQYNQPGILYPVSFLFA